MVGKIIRKESLRDLKKICNKFLSSVGIPVISGDFIKLMANRRSISGVEIKDYDWKDNT